MNKNYYVIDDGTKVIKQTQRSSQNASKQRKNNVLTPKFTAMAALTEKDTFV